MEETPKPILINLPEVFILTSDTANGTVWDSKIDREVSPYKARVCSIPRGCGQALYLIFYKGSKLDDGRVVNGLFDILEPDFYGVGGAPKVKHFIKDCYLEMTINLNNDSEFTNPLKDRYSNVEYITKYVDLLRKMGLICYISGITATKVFIRIDYDAVKYFEKNFLVLNWQAIRNLHLGYTMHVPTRFIELSELFPEQDLFTLFRIAYRFIPMKCIINMIGSHTIGNYNPFVKKVCNDIGVNILNLDIDSKNLREKVSSIKAGLTENLVPTSLNTQKIIGSTKYMENYEKLVSSTSKEELWNNIEKIILKNNKTELKTNKTEETCQIF